MEVEQGVVCDIIWQGHFISLSTILCSYRAYTSDVEGTLLAWLNVLRSTVALVLYKTILPIFLFLPPLPPTSI